LWVWYGIIFGLLPVFIIGLLSPLSRPLVPIIGLIPFWRPDRQLRSNQEQPHDHDLAQRWQRQHQLGGVEAFAAARTRPTEAKTQTCAQNFLRGQYKVLANNTMAQKRKMRKKWEFEASFKCQFPVVSFQLSVSSCQFPVVSY